MNISGVLVHAKPKRIDAVKDAISVLPGVEIHETTDDGRLILTIEEEGDKSAGEALMKMSLLPDVLSASLVYHQHTDEEV